MDRAGLLEGESTVSELNMTQEYSKRVGERIRSIRRQKRLSLQEVEASSNQEFKASVLGAYERGERAISVPRLQRLSRRRRWQPPKAPLTAASWRRRW